MLLFFPASLVTCFIAVNGVRAPTVIGQVETQLLSVRCRFDNYAVSCCHWTNRLALCPVLWEEKGLVVSLCTNKQN